VWTEASKQLKLQVKQVSSAIEKNKGFLAGK